ncbi:T7SS effector LXG polymorphic toxin [Pseudogracilibacillus auburnensis]|uniref:T7SS effector LXG polymorphic toxin n=1 Tax=Pseudogracilibacillus auburnensis TaxID=1494959 RepID=UPI001FD2F9F3|nr:LXG domain-containing protein [Pseudogracilibacillus auburnensis]
MSLESSFKGKAAESIRMFYATCHKPFLLYMTEVLQDYKKTLVEMQEAIHSYEPESDGFIEQNFLESDIEQKLNKLVDVTQGITDEVNKKIYEVQDIVSLPKLNEIELIQKVQEAKKKTKTTIENLHELDHAQSNALDRMLCKTEKMKNYVEEIGSMLHNGDITVLDFNPNQLRDSGAFNELVGKVNPVEDGFIKFVNILSTIEPLIFFLHPDKMLPVLYRNHPVTASDLDKLKETKEYQDLSEENKLTKEEDALRKYLHNLEPNSGGNPFAGYENPDYGPITYQDRRKVMGGNSPYAGTMEGLPLIGNVLYGEVILYITLLARLMRLSHYLIQIQP